MNKNKKIIVSIILTLILLISGTYAYIYFFTEKTDVTMTVDGDKISFNAGENITLNGILPVYTKEEGIVKDIEIYKENGNYTAGIDLYLKLTTWPTSFSNNSMRWELHKNGNYLSSGSFSGKSKGQSIKLTSYIQKINLEEDKDNYKLYIWMDAYTESSTNMMNQSFSVSVYGQVSYYYGNEVIVNNVEANAPELADSMIPIRYNYIVDEWQKADSTNINNNWYDYENKMWANAALVESSSREYYMNAEVGTTLNNEDILAYYVWIPRYKYVLFNANSEVTEPREIQIEFEKTTDPISQGDENGEFLSHPSFWWDNNSDGIRAEDLSEELSGIWVGKFENGGSTSVPLIKPNIAAVHLTSLALHFSMNKNINNINYLKDTDLSQIDAHMMKNTDWGCVAYLSHSRYGINSNIAKNDNNDILSGRQGNYTYNDFLVSNGVITLNKSPGTGVKASTTGNVYGIYDMYGGAAEYVMMLIKTSSTNDAPYISSGGIGFNTSTLPESKYYDLYDYGTTTTEYNRSILGDATGETSGWYSSDSVVITYASPVRQRGGYHKSTSSYFAINDLTAYAAAKRGSRSVIVLP